MNGRQSSGEHSSQRCWGSPGHAAQCLHHCTESILPSKLGSVGLMAACNRLLRMSPASWLAGLAGRLGSLCNSGHITGRPMVTKVHALDSHCIQWQAPFAQVFPSSAHLCLIAVADLKPYRRTSLLLQYCVCLHVAVITGSSSTRL